VTKGGFPVHRVVHVDREWISTGPLEPSFAELTPSMSRRRLPPGTVRWARRGVLTTPDFFRVGYAGSPGELMELAGINEP